MNNNIIALFDSVGFAISFSSPPNCCRSIDYREKHGANNKAYDILEMALLPCSLL